MSLSSAFTVLLEFQELERQEPEEPEHGLAGGRGKGAGIYTSPPQRRSEHQHDWACGGGGGATWSEQVMSHNAATFFS